MKSQLLALSLASYLFAGFCSAAESAQFKWHINPNSSTLTFHLNNMGMPVNGKFTKLSGEVTYNDNALDSSTVQARIDTSSIDTGLGLRDQHLKSNDFFNVVKFPDADFRSVKIQVKPNGAFQIFGTLSLHGVSQQLILDAKPLTKQVDQAGHNHLLASASTSLKRKQFGIGGITAMTVGDDVTIDLSIDLLPN